VTTHATGPQELATILAIRMVRVGYLIVGPSLTEEDVDAHERDGGLLRWEVGDTGNRSGDGYNELADGHADGSHEQKVATAHGLDKIQSRKG